MLATLADPPLAGSSLVFEPKYDGIRALIEIEPARERGFARPAPAAAQPRAHVRIWSRLGNDKTTQFPSIVSALAAFGATVAAPLVLDGEIVALDAKRQTDGISAAPGAGFT